MGNSFYYGLPFEIEILSRMITSSYLTPSTALISFGIRNISKSEIPYLKKNSSRINIFWAKDKANWNLNKFKKMIINNQK